MNDRAWERLADADRLLTYGLYGQAEAIYAEVLRDVPRSSEAAFGLARVALEQGDEQLAYERALAAVRIDAGNDDAQRLATRLDEILRTRRAGAAQPPRPPVRPSERHALARNPSMADHRAEERRRSGE